MVTTLLVAALAVTPAVAVNAAADGRALRGTASAINDVSIVVWTDDRDFFRRGDRVRVYFRSATDGYVTIFRVDTDGRVRVIYPVHPWDDNYVQGGRRHEVRSPYTEHGKRAFVVDDYPGQGYLFAVVSLDPFHYADYVSNGRWDYRFVGRSGRITGDPYVALTDLIDRIVPLGYQDYGYDVYTYHVERRYEYPRFVCYDCHRYVAYPVWNPYHEWCASFRIVIYDRYPARVYPYTVELYSPRTVVYRRPVRLEPRFVFEPRAPGQPPVTRTSPPPASADGIPVREREREPVRRAPAVSTEPSREQPERGATRRPTLERRVPATQPTPERRPAARPDDRRGAEPVAREDDRAVPAQATPARTPPGRRPAPQAGTAPAVQKEKEKEKDKKKPEQRRSP